MKTKINRIYLFNMNFSTNKKALPRLARLMLFNILICFIRCHKYKIFLQKQKTPTVLKAGA